MGRGAWAEIEPLFGQAEATIGAVEPEKLRDHGLYGVQLKLKLEGTRTYVRLASVVLDSLSPRSEMIFEPAPLPFITRARKKVIAAVVKLALGGIDNVIDSIAAVFPLLGAFSEFKKHLEWSAEVAAQGVAG